MAATTYKIYLINRSVDSQIFWCFLARPPELANDPGVYAISSASLVVPPNDHGGACFEIPMQYAVAAGAENAAVGPNVRIVSDVTVDASLQQQFDVTYGTVQPPNLPKPAISLSTTSSPPNTIALTSNAFDRTMNEKEFRWFSNMSFGIRTGTGLIGMTWSPAPQTTRTLTPALTFYIATGMFDRDVLARWRDVSDNSMTVAVPGSFQDSNCTVTYFSGAWSWSPGAPHPGGGN